MIASRTHRVITTQTPRSLFLILLSSVLVLLATLVGCNNSSSNDNAAKITELPVSVQQVAPTPRDANQKANVLAVDTNAPFPALTTDVLRELSIHVPKLAQHRDTILKAEQEAIKRALDDFRSKIKPALHKVSRFDAGSSVVLLPLVGLMKPHQPMSTTAILNRSTPWLTRDVWSWVPTMTQVAFAQEATGADKVTEFFEKASAVSPDIEQLVGEMYMLLAGSQAYRIAGSIDPKGSDVVSSHTGNNGKEDATVTWTPHKEGPPTLEIASSVNQILLGLKANSKVTLTTNFCPAPDGSISFAIKYSGDGTAGNNSAVSYAHEVEAKVIATVDDDANLASADFQFTQSTRSSSATGGKPIYVETSRTARMAGKDYRQWQYSDPKLVRESSNTTYEDRGRLAGKGLIQAAQLANGALIVAESVWQDGKCVEIKAQSPGTVKPNATSKIPIEVVHKMDGAKVPAKLVANLSGGASISPAVIPRTPGEITHIAVDKDGVVMSIKLTATSKRGKAEETLQINTKGMVYKLEGGADEFHGTGIVCDFEKPFQVKGDGLTVKFTPSSKTGGTYNYSGTLQGFGAWGKGSYTVTYNGDNPVHVTAKGPGTVKTPMGDMTAEGTEEYSVSASQSGCPYDKLLLDN